MDQKEQLRQLQRWLMSCPIEDFMAVLRRIEEAKGITWSRPDAYAWPAHEPEKEAA